jgi:hypothetical protein
MAKVINMAMLTCGSSKLKLQNEIPLVDKAGGQDRAEKPIRIQP